MSAPAPGSTSAIRPLSTAVIVRRDGLRQWQVDALKRSEASGLIRVEAVLEARRNVRAMRELALGLLAAIESIRVRSERPLRRRCRPDAQWPRAEIRAFPRGNRWAASPPRGWDLIVNLAAPELTEPMKEIAGVGVLEFWLGGSGDVDDAIDLLATRSRTIELVGSLVTRTGGFDVTRSVPALRSTPLVLHSLERLLARATVVLTRAIAAVCARPEANSSPSPSRRPGKVATSSRTRAAGLVLSAVGDYARVALRRAASGPDTWFLAYRESPDHFVANTHAFSPEGFTALMPPPGHTHSDPCVVSRGGCDHVFFEDYSYASGKGTIAWMHRVGPGEFSPVETVLECPYHLSYPFVFEHEGQVYMIPETAQARRIELYRSIRFPRSWERVAILLDDVRAVDATLLQKDGLWWMFANIGGAGSSSTWDELFAFHSESPLGRWKPHPANPVKSDVRSARPAGRFFWRDGRLIRPAQNCSHSYGGSLALCEVLELTPSAYAERVVEDIGPEWMQGNRGFHTLSSSERIEFIDGRLSKSARVDRGGRGRRRGSDRPTG